jgi:hypothetical protein
MFLSSFTRLPLTIFPGRKKGTKKGSLTGCGMEKYETHFSHLWSRFISRVRKHKSRVSGAIVEKLRPQTMTYIVSRRVKGLSPEALEYFFSEKKNLCKFIQ